MSVFNSPAIFTTSVSLPEKISRYSQHRRYTCWQTPSSVLLLCTALQESLNILNDPEIDSQSKNHISCYMYNLHEDSIAKKPHDVESKNRVIKGNFNRPPTHEDRNFDHE